MDTLALPLLVYYIAIVAVFCIYGLHRYWLVWTFVRSGARGGDEEPAGRFDDLPVVTVQLPMFNELHVAERVITAACSIDYPRDRLQVQVLDDSNDGSEEIARRCCERLARAGHDVEYLHRTDRTGYKAGALAEGLTSARGDLIAMFDADFIPPPEILQQTVHHFTDDSIGLVQARWEHLNRNDSLLTRIQALCLDGHFVIEQAARSRAGRWFNFNGTAGIWRRRCIDDAGGWQHDTLTEDTDLSYRAQLRGWRFRFLSDVTCPAELPPTIGAFMTQQHRWNKGLAQNALKLMPTIARSRCGWKTKLDAWFHLTSPLPYAAMLLLTVLVAPAFLIGLPRTGISPAFALGLGVGCLGLGTLAACTFYLASQWAQRLPLAPAILRLPALMALGVGVSVLNTRAICEALGGRVSPFVRTPKFAGETESAPDPIVARRRLLPPGIVEFTLGLVMVACAALTVSQPFTLVGLPFIVLFGSGYFAVGIPQILRWSGLPQRVAGVLRPVPAPPPPT
ncbi:MAG: glycosyltransferase [Planctomycetes bacterium]|nr:glycosyltransferase [Planctomycetota bacterium]